MGDRWDIPTVVCIKEYKTIKVGKHYRITGRGNLEFNNDPNVGGRKGHGYCVVDDSPSIINWKSRNPDDKKDIWYYFTENEMNEYFITESEDYKIYLRDQKINSVIND